MNKYLLAVCGALFTIFGVYQYGHHAGWTERDQEMQSEIARKNEESRAAEQKLTQQLTTQSAQLKEANNVLDQKQSALDRAIRAGRVRLPAPGCVSAPQSSTPPTGDRHEKRSEPDPTPNGPTDAERATLAAIAEIVAQGDRNTAQLNACIDSYNQVLEVLNGKR